MMRTVAQMGIGKRILSLAFITACLGIVSQAQQTVVLTFEGLGNDEPVAQYYNGGQGGNGSGPGPNYGIYFSDNSLALIRSGAGGSGIFSNEPSPDTVVYFMSGDATTMNVPAGFQNGFSFYYASSESAQIRVYDGVNATGNLLALLDLPATPNPYTEFVPIGVPFSGTAYSVDFAGGANFVAFDNITLGSEIPGSDNDRVEGDYDGDGVSDPTVFDPVTGNWFVLKQSGDLRALAWYLNWGFRGVVAVPGDYNGNGRNDLAVYDPATGNWYIRTLEGEVLAWELNWGFPGGIPVPGDYDGDGKSDLAIYDPATGAWYVRRLDMPIIGIESPVPVLAWEFIWGFAGGIPVPGDFDGDGISDLAVYNPANGNWFILRTPPLRKDLEESVLAWDFNWGFPGAMPVCGDFDGDGRSDLAVYDPANGNWFVRRLPMPVPAAPANPVILWNENWGFPGAVPVSGDYDGDGKTNMAVYDDDSLNWWIRSVDGRIINWSLDWGYPGAIPVSPTPLR